MNCNHCPSLRRGEGGLEIGGRVDLTTVTTCPCSTLLRVPDNSYYTIINVTLEVTTLPNEGTLELTYRFCPVFAGNVVPKILSVTSNNYPNDELYNQVILAVYRGSTPLCDADYLYPAESEAAYFNGDIIDGDPFSAVPGSGLWYAVKILLTCDRLAEPFVDPPRMTVDLKFERV